MRLIDAERLDVFAAKCPDGRDVYSFMDGVTAVLEEVDKLPAINLVRCKDCKEWDEEKHWCGIRDSYGWDYKPNDYCSYGVRKWERKDDEQIR